MVELEIHQHFSAPPEKVFAAVTDHKRIEEWQKGTRVTIEKPGVPPPNGLGAVRKIRGGPLSVQEEVVRWVASAIGCPGTRGAASSGSSSANSSGA